MNPSREGITPQPHAPHQARQVRRLTAWGLVANLALSGLKFVAGLAGASQALIADAVHSLTDSTTDLVVLIGTRYWSAPADAEHPHGHGRIETMITVLIGVVLGGVGVGLAYNALSTLHLAHRARPGWIAFVVACVSIASKELLYRWTVRMGRRIKSSALIANAWHHRSDGLSSLPVAIAVLGTRLRPDWVYLDHVAAVIVSLLILQAACTIVWPALKRLADAGASQEERERLHALVNSSAGVRAVHALRTRHIGPGLQVDLHVLVDPNLTVHDGHRIAHEVKSRLLEEGPDVVDVLVHVEPHEAQPATTPANAQHSAK